MIQQDKPQRLDYETSVGKWKPGPLDYLVLTIFCFFMVAPLLFVLIAVLVAGPFVSAATAFWKCQVFFVVDAVVSIASGLAVFRELTRPRGRDH